jgi:hypothetical protein
VANIITPPINHFPKKYTQEASSQSEMPNHEVSSAVVQCGKPPDSIPLHADQRETWLPLSPHRSTSINVQQSEGFSSVLPHIAPSSHCMHGDRPQVKCRKIRSIYSTRRSLLPIESAMHTDLTSLQTRLQYTQRPMNGISNACSLLCRYLTQCQLFCPVA